MRSQMVLEVDKVSRPDGLAEREEDGSQSLALLALEQYLRREPPEEDVAGN
jgi:hypothetical protein